MLSSILYTLACLSHRDKTYEVSSAVCYANVRFKTFFRDVNENKFIYLRASGIVDSNFVCSAGSDFKVA